MGEPARADHALIPRAIGHDDPAYTLGTGELQYEDNYQMLHDNLLDLTHLSYVHENTLGRKSISWGQAQASSSLIPRGVRVQRWLRDTLSASYAPLPDGTRVDQWSAYDLAVPGVFCLKSSGYPVGTAEQFPAKPDGIEPMYPTVTSQAVTPMTETSTIYYYSDGQRTEHMEEERLRRQIELFGVAFREDKAMIEAQQAVINHSPHKTMITLSFDRSVGRFRRLMATLIEDETK